MCDQKYLAHHGILGQKWGIRRFQNEDGSRTQEGLNHLRETRHDQSLQENLEQTSKRSSLDPETAAALKSAAKSLGSIALAYGAKKYLAPQVQKQLTTYGERLAVKALQELPKAPLHAINGSRAIVVTGMKTTNVTMRGGAGLVKVGGTIAKTGWNIATSGFKK